MNIEKIEQSIKEDLKDRGHSHEAIAAMTPEEAFAEYCSWQGLIGWGPQLIEALDNLRAADGKIVKEEPAPSFNKETRYVALLKSHDGEELKTFRVPKGQSLEFDEGSADRKWLRPALGTRFHLLSFYEIEDI